MVRLIRYWLIVLKLNHMFVILHLEFMSLPELQQNPLVQRVIDIFDTDQNGEVDFKGTKNIMSLFRH